MRVLLDECVPRSLTRGLAPHDVRTVQAMGWSGIKNGALLARAAVDFEALFTIDKDFAGRRDSTGNSLILVILLARSSDPVLLQPHMSAVRAALEQAQPGQVVRVGA